MFQKPEENARQTEKYRSRRNEKIPKKGRGAACQPAGKNNSECLDQSLHARKSSDLLTSKHLLHRTRTVVGLSISEKLELIHVPHSKANRPSWYMRSMVDLSFWMAFHPSGSCTALATGTPARDEQFDSE